MIALLNYSSETKFPSFQGEDKFTFVEDVKNPHSVTILIKGQQLLKKCEMSNKIIHLCKHLYKQHWLH